MIEIRAILLKERPKVLGSEINAIRLISLKLILKENLGVNPHPREANNWIKKCIDAPKTTPNTKPLMPKIGYKKMMPMIMPKL